MDRAQNLWSKLKRFPLLQVGRTMFAEMAPLAANADEREQLYPMPLNVK